MSTRTTTMPAPRLNGRKVAAIVAQAGSLATTYLCFAALGFTGLQAFAWALVAEGLLIAGKSLVLTDGDHADMLGVIAIAVDTLLNAGGIWPIIQRLDQTPPALMLSEALNINGDMHGIPTLLIAVGLGYLLSIAPHRLWHSGKRGGSTYDRSPPTA